MHFPGILPPYAPRRTFASSWCTVLSLLTAVTITACNKHPTAPLPSTPPSTYSADASPAWSPDGALIAFHRCVASSIGPPGVYVVPAWGGRPRYVAPGDGFWPTRLRFSPDGTRLVCVYGLQLYLIDVTTGTTTRLLYTEAGADGPDWSPSGRYIVYSRVFYESGWPPESTGIHRLDLLTGADLAIPATPATGSPIYAGALPCWSPDGRRIAFIETWADHDGISLIDTSGTIHSVLAESPTGALLDDLRWYSRPSQGLSGLIFMQITRPGGPYYINWNGCCLQSFDRYFGRDEAYSPNGEWRVGPEVDSRNGTVVLFVRRVGDVQGASRRQLTFWAPQAGGDP